MSKAGRETEDVGVDRVPAYLPQGRLPQAQLAFPTEASVTPAVPAAPPRAAPALPALADKRDQFPTAVPAGWAMWGPQGPAPHCPHTLQSQLVPHR